ncbi:MAG: FkbM family methyltransferase [Gemmatimonadales bacterium]
MNALQGAARHIAESVGRDSILGRALGKAYAWLLIRTSGKKGITWPINGVTYRIDPRYRHQLGQEYDPPVAEFLRTGVEPGALCLDVGANVGVYVLQFAHWSRPNGHVIAFEPNPAAREVLARHLAMNALEDRVEIVPAAVGRSRGEAVLHAAAADGMSRLAAPNPELSGRTSPVTVPVINLGEFCADRRLEPDWLLVDIEGFEIAALAGAADLIRARGPSLGMVIEMHPNAWPVAGTTRSDAEELLHDLGLVPVSLTGQSDPLGEHGLVHLAFKSAGGSP